MENLYCKSLRDHYENYFHVKGEKKKWNEGPIHKLDSEFYVLEIKPNEIHSMWTYLTVGMSLDGQGEDLIELFLYAPCQSNYLVELLTINASFHRNVNPLNLNHTVNIGQSWLDESKCDHGFISLPYLDGNELELFNFKGKTIHCYWFIPITKKERDYKVKNGYESLERIFEEKEFNYLNPNRSCLFQE